MADGTLFTRDFLERGICETREWKELDDKVIADFKATVGEIFRLFPHDKIPNETHTEDDLIWKVLDAVGWKHSLRQQNLSAKGRENVPDGLLFSDEDAKMRANGRVQDYQRYADGLAIVESKRWGRPLDRENTGKGEDIAVPSTQMLRYLRRVDDLSEGKLRWGMLTNGREWRLYWQGAKSKSEDFLGLDLPVLAEVEGFERDLFDGDPDHFLKVFYLMFRREAFLPVDEVDARSFHILALEEGKYWETRVAKNLSDMVFDHVFPDLIAALAKADPDAPEPQTPVYLSAVRDAALTLLYRLLFVLYAEDRNLLPVRDERYDDYGMRMRVREDIGRRLDKSDPLSSKAANYWNHLRTLFRAIAEGDESLGLPPYNGGLFDQGGSPILARVEIADAQFAPIIDRLSRLQMEDGAKWINYRDLTVQQLGSIYERLLEFEPVVESDGGIAVRPNVFARKGSGSYYTPDDMVRLIIERTVGPLVDERREIFRDRAETLRSNRRPKHERLNDLRSVDAAESILDLKVCDPAMGSGHFLVSLVDFLADSVLETIEEQREIVDWADEDESYRSPLLGKIEKIRRRILDHAEKGQWVLAEKQLDDRHLIRRMILKRVIYGVDKNPMAVELAKVALWLHTFTVGAPLSFLDHHLRCGDSLFGELIRPVEDVLAKRGAMYIHRHVAAAKGAAAGMTLIEENPDADLAAVKDSAEKFEGVEDRVEPLEGFLNFFHACRWLNPKDLTRRAYDAILDGGFGDPVRVAAGLDDPERPETKAQSTLFSSDSPKQLSMGQKSVDNVEVWEEAIHLIDEAQKLLMAEKFLHWQIAFPGVWSDWESGEPRGGFDAVIGNPPWDQFEFEEVPWFEARLPEIARAETDADRKRLIRQLFDTDDPLSREYQLASARILAASKVVRSEGQYEFFSKGRLNLYSLFVERALSLLAPHGLVGLLVPSGVVSDKGAAKFVEFISANNRISVFFDFENKRGNRPAFFSAVDSRFKFSALVLGARLRSFSHAECAFFLNSTNEIESSDKIFKIDPRNFSRLNPNTSTMPVFRFARDADINIGIYEKLPILNNKRDQKKGEVWPLQYSQMLNRSTDSNLFISYEELINNNYYPVEFGKYKGKDTTLVLLYEGKMVQSFDHRAASIVVNPDNLFRPGQPKPATIEQHMDPNWFPSPQFWVRSSDVRWPPFLSWVLAYKDVTSATNARTAITALIPFCAAAHTIPVIFPRVSNNPDTTDEEITTLWEMEVHEKIARYKKYIPLLCANYNSLIYDYLARQKVHTNHLSWYIVEQLPVIPDEAYNNAFGPKTARGIVRDHVLRLTYTAHDMTPFARDMEYEGDPFIWDEEERRHLRARLDALYFHLYGIDREDAAYILDTFPIVRDHDEKEFGRYRTKEMVLAYMSALAAGDPDTQVAV